MSGSSGSVRPQALAQLTAETETALVNAVERAADRSGLRGQVDVHSAGSVRTRWFGRAALSDVLIEIRVLPLDVAVSEDEA